MLIPILVSAIVILGTIFAYMYYIAPKLNPINKAENYLAMNMVDEAIREYKKILDRNPSNFMVHYKLAELYFKRDELDKGVLHLEKIIRINKFNYEVEKIEVQHRLAKAYLLRKEIENAFEIYLDMLKFYPGDL